MQRSAENASKKDSPGLQPDGECVSKKAVTVGGADRARPERSSGAETVAGDKKTSGTMLRRRRLQIASRRWELVGRHIREHRDGTDAAREWGLALPRAQQLTSQASPREGRRNISGEERCQRSSMQLHKTCRYEGLHPGLPVLRSGLATIVFLSIWPWRSWLKPRQHGNHGRVVRDRREFLCAQYDYCAGKVLGHL